GGGGPVDPAEPAVVRGAGPGWPAQGPSPAVPIRRLLPGLGRGDLDRGRRPSESEARVLGGAITVVGPGQPRRSLGATGRRGWPTAMNCFQAKAGQLTPQWFVIDATGMVVGRLAAQIAPILMGKHRPTYTPHIDTGDYVIVTNVDKVVFTGNKWQQKAYQRYTGYPGGQRDEAAWKLFQRHPERILELAVQRMMPKSKLGRHMMDKLKLYSGTEHPHQAQC